MYICYRGSHKPRANNPKVATKLIRIRRSDITIIERLVELPSSELCARIMSPDGLIIFGTKYHALILTHSF